MRQPTDIYGHSVFQMQFRWRPLVPVGLVVASLLLGSCSTSNSATSTSTTANRSGELCALLSPSDVQAVVGYPVGIPRRVFQGSTTDCLYKSANPHHAVHFRFNNEASTSTFQSEMSAYAALGNQLSRVTGIGDEAFSFSQVSGPETKNTIVARSGNTQVLVSGFATMAQVETLARSALSKAG